MNRIVQNWHFNIVMSSNDINKKTCKYTALKICRIGFAIFKSTVNSNGTTIYTYLQAHLILKKNCLQNWQFSVLRWLQIILYNIFINIQAKNRIAQNWHINIMMSSNDINKYKYVNIQPLIFTAKYLQYLIVW